MEFNPPSFDGHKYIIVVVEYFMKWDEAMPTFNIISTTIAQLFFNHVITQFGVPKKLVSDHGWHFEYQIWNEFAAMLGFEHQYYYSYYL